MDDSDDVHNGKIGNLIPLERQLNEKCRGKMIDEKLALYSKSSFQTARNIYDRYKGKSNTFNIDDRTTAMAIEFFDKVLRFKVSAESGITESTRKNKRTTHSKKKETIGDIVGYHEKPAKEIEDIFEGQISLFDKQYEG